MRDQPTILLHNSIEQLLRELPNIREGTEEGFHQGRVAIRRIREVLAVMGGHFDKKALSRLETALAGTAKVLGRVRDADVAQHVVQHVESRFLLPAAMGRLRSALATEQLEARRRSIKEIESLDASKLHKELGAARRGGRFWRPRSPAWQSTMRQHVAGRAGEVRSAVAHAGGVYFPNRVHNARIAIKRLRYALELARATETFRVPQSLRVLRRVQSALGDAHDREVVIAQLKDANAAATNDAEIERIEYFLHAEIQSLHAEYLKLRPDVLAVCNACDQARPTRRVPRGWLVAASVAMPALLLAKRAGSPKEGGRTVVRRIPVPLREVEVDGERQGV